MNVLFWGLTLSVVGKVLLAIGVFRAHSAVVREQKVDRKVVKSFRAERFNTILGLSLIIIGYALEIYFYSLTHLLTCEGEACAASFSAIILPQ